MTARRSRWQRLLAGPVEYVTLPQALHAADAVSTERRQTLANKATEASEKRDAAELLLSHGSRGEAITLAIACAHLMSECVEAVGDSGPLMARRARRALEDIDWAAAKLTPPPVLDNQVTRAHEAALRTILSAELALVQPLREALLSRPQLKRLRVQRAVVVALVALSPIAAGVFIRASFLGITARASSVLDDQYTADRVLDGDPDTEWVASGGEEWLELRFRPRVVHTLGILNGDTLPDRAVKTMHVDFYNGNESHATSPRTFKQQHPAQWQTYDLGGIKCDRIRIVITEHYGSGAAVSEVEVK